jgi:hypothetical protein
MYTAKIIQKIQDPSTRVWIVDVEFTNGTDTFVESIKPQDKAGFDHWLQSRLKSLNGLRDLIEEDNLNVVISPVTTNEPVLTQAEIERNAWLEKYYKWVRIKTTMIDTGILTGQETQVQNFLADLKAGFKPAYIDVI